MTFGFMNFNNLNMSGFSIRPLDFSMPALFNNFPPLFSFKTQLESFNFGSQTNIDTSLYRDEVLAAFNTPTTGRQFDSYKLTDFSLDGFEPISYAPKPLNLTLPNFNFTTAPAVAAKTAKINKSKVNTFVTPGTTTSIADVAKIYNKSKGISLTNATYKGLSSSRKGYCSEAVKNGIQDAGLGAYVYGDAYEVPRILSSNKNFKKVSIKGNDLNKLPAGCVMCYPPGDSGYSAKYGHVETTDGKGNAVSFFVNNNIKKSDKVTVFVPV